MAPGQAPHKWVIAGTVLTGTFMAVLDASVVNVALPHMSGTLGATLEEITWVATGYLLANVLIMPVIALISARFGRKRFYMVSVFAFTLASMACGAARNLPAMVAFRAVQGLGGGAMITVAQAILRETFPVEEQGLAMGIYGVGIVVAPALGPTLGGWLTDQYSWPWIFYVNVPIGVINLLLVQRYIFDPPYFVRHKDRVDWSGLGLMAVGLGALQLMLEKGQEKEWFSSSLICWLAAFAVVGLVAFVWRELTTERPAVELKILRNVPFASGTALGGVLGMGMFGTLFLLPMFLQNLLGFPAMTSGVAMLPRSIASAVVGPIGGRFYNKVGPRVLVAVGLALNAYGFWQFSHLTTQVGVWDLLWPQVWQGAGMGLLFVAIATAALATIPKPRMTAATGLYNVVRQVSASIGIAIAANQVDAGTHRFHDQLAEGVTMYSEGARTMLQRMTGAMIQAGGDSVTAVQRGLAIMNGRVTRQAVVLAYNHLFQLAAMLFVVSLPLTLMLKGQRGARGATPATIPPAPPRPTPRRRPEPVPLQAPAEVEELVGAGSH
ncbi:MAG: DHA2 family efflux MFS transporter permease subunit [Gemmatimonadales bacterium]|jgi:DHA2 family multidrug resistance protein